MSSISTAHILFIYRGIYERGQHLPQMVHMVFRPYAPKEQLIMDIGFKLEISSL